MSKEVLRIVNNLDVSSLEMQLALQCAPVISGLKISNLLSVKKEYVNKLDYILRDKKSLKKFSKNSIKKANEFVPKRIIKIWESVLEDEK